MGSKVGHYELLAEFASGGMATVHFGRLVRPGGFTKTVAIKRLRPQYTNDPAVVRMLLHEARVTGFVDHPNVVSTLDVVATDNDIFVVMEYVRGDSLSSILASLRSTGQLAPPHVVAAILSDVLHGLHAAHDATDGHGRRLGIVHRDVSPHNVLVGIDGVARIADFGVSKSTSATLAQPKGAGGEGIVGKLRYLAPEVVIGKPATPRTDVYCAGIVLWEALTGRRLFTGDGEQEIVEAVMSYTAPPPSRFAPEVIAALDEVVLTALERDEQRRFASAHDMAMALESSTTVARHSEVAAWVKPLVEARVDRRLHILEETTHARAVVTFSASGPMGRSADTPPTENTLVDPEPRTPTLRRHGRLIARTAVAASVLAGTVAVGVGLRRNVTPPVDSVSAKTVAPADQPESAPSQASAAAPAPTALATTEPPAPAQTEESTGEASTTKNAMKRDRSPVGHKPAPRRSTRSSVDCTKKFTIDAEGHTIFRKECL